MANTAALSPTSARDNGSFWSNVTNALSSNNIYATSTVAIAGFGSTIVVSGFDFSSIPTDSIIDGFEIEIEDKASTSSSISRYTIYLYDNYSLEGSLSLGSPYVSTTESIVTYGDATNLFGWTDVTRPDLDSNFEVGILYNFGTTSDIVSLDHITIKVYYSANVVPIADAGDDDTGYTSIPYTLDGSGSDDSDSSPNTSLTYSWSWDSVPSGSSSVLSPSTEYYPSFTPDLAGDYVASLIVNDGASDSLADTVTISVASLPEEHDTGWLIPGSSNQADLNAGPPWVNPGNITSDNTANYAWSDPTGNEDQTDWLISLDYDFSSIPSTAILLGIEFQVEAMSPNGSDLRDYIVRLFDYENSTLIGVGANTGTSLTTSWVDYSYGGSRDLWYIHLTYPSFSISELDSRNIGLAVAYTNVSVQATSAKPVYVNTMRMKVHYAYDESGETVVPLMMSPF